MDLNSIFIKILNMGIAATYVILLVLVARLFLRKLPRIYSYCLWALVGVRLLFPVLIPSAFSLFNMDAFWKVAEEPGQRMAFISQEIEYELTPQINTGSAFVDQSVNQILPPANLQGSANPMQIWLFVGAWIWIFGIIVMLGYMFISYLSIGKQVKYAIRLTEECGTASSSTDRCQLEGQGEFEQKKHGLKIKRTQRKKLLREHVAVYECDNISSPFVFGIFRPRIYIPFHLEEKEREYILAHERYHIRRGDPIVKMLAFFIVCIYWFHPLVWLSYVLLGKDMEMSCDEKVLQTLGGEIKEDYSRSLLSFATGKRWHLIQPLAFGESFAGMRIKNVLRFQKPSLWLGIVGGVLVVALTFVCLTDREKENILYVESVDVAGVGDFAAKCEYSFAPDVNSYLVYAEVYEGDEYQTQMNLAAGDLKSESRSGEGILKLSYDVLVKDATQEGALLGFEYQPDDSPISGYAMNQGEVKYIVHDCIGFSAVFGRNGDEPYHMEKEHSYVIGTGYTANQGGNRKEVYTPDQLRKVNAIADNSSILLTNNGYTFVMYMVLSEKDSETLLETYLENPAAREQHDTLILISE